MSLVIKKLREAKGIKQDELAHRAELRVGTLSDIENGKVSPRLDSLEKIAAALEVRVADLFDGNGLPSDEESLLVTFRTLTEDEKAALLKLLAR